MARTTTMVERVVRIETTLENVSKELERLAVGVERFIPEVTRLSVEAVDLTKTLAAQQAEINVLKEFKTKVLTWASIVSTAAAFLVTMGVKLFEHWKM